MAISTNQRRRIKEEAGFRCAVPHCNATSPLELHHIIYQANGGQDTDDNLICLCASCHGRHHAGEIPTASIRGYKLRARKISLALFPHEYNYLASLAQGQLIELSAETINMARRLQTEGFVNINEVENGNFQLAITTEGREFIQ